MRACIFGAGDYHGERLDLCRDAVIIAADGGFRYTERYGLSISLAIGDFDSLGEVPTGVSVKRHPVAKDDTDMALAAKEAILLGCRELILFGALGGRLDHTLANITLLRSLAREGISAYLVGKNAVMTAVSSGESLRFTEKPSGTLSIFSLSEEVILTLDGVLYPLSSGTLYADTARGVSNEFLEKDALIRVEAGEALVYFENEALGLPIRERMAV